MILVIQDVHWKIKEPYFSGLRNLFDWLLKQYPEHTYIFTGDFFDISSPNWQTFVMARDYLLRMPYVHIVRGNHDYSSIKGNSLSALNLHRNISVYSAMSEVKINGNNFLMLPYDYKSEVMKAYENVTGYYDYVVTHVTPARVAFGDEGIDLRVKAKAIFHGHEHLSKDFQENEVTNHIIGVPQVTRNGEQEFKKRMFEIKSDGSYQEIQLPIFMDIQDIKYGERIENKNFLYNVYDAPSQQAVWEMYPKKEGYHIRDAGIEVFRSASEIQEMKENLNWKNLEEVWSNENWLGTKESKEVIQCGLDYFSRV